MTPDPPVPSGPIHRSPVGFRPESEQAEVLAEALQAAGVELGAYDRYMIEWLAGWEWSTVATITSWIQRAAGN